MGKVTCEVNEHKVEQAQTYIYSDEPNGIKKPVRICTKCLHAHVSRHYPGGTIQTELEYHHPQLKAGHE